MKHVGRRSGREYRNPVSAYPLEDGFVIAVLYGAESRWVRNVIATGRFRLRPKGHDYLLGTPEWNEFQARRLGLALVSARASRSG